MQDVDLKVFKKEHRLIFNHQNVELYISNFSSYYQDNIILNMFMNVTKSLNLKYPLKIVISDDIHIEKSYRGLISDSSNEEKLLGTYVQEKGFIYIFVRHFNNCRGAFTKKVFKNLTKSLEKNGKFFVFSIQENMESVLMHEIAHHIYGKRKKLKKGFSEIVYPSESEFSKDEFKELKSILKNNRNNFTNRFDFILHPYYLKTTSEYFAEYFSVYVFLKKNKERVPEELFEVDNLKFMEKIAKRVIGEL